MNIIVAIDKSNGIGKNNKLLAHIGPDLRYFKEKTLNNVVVMGYNTYMSLPKRPLQNRTNIVLTTKNIEIDGAIVINSLEALLDKIKDFEDKGKEVFICGGGNVYKQLLPYADKLYITKILYDFDADTFFPEIDLCKWKLISVFADVENITHKYPHTFSVYERK